MIQKIVTMILISNHLENNDIDCNFESFFKSWFWFWFQNVLTMILR